MALVNFRLTWTDNSTGDNEETGTDIQISTDSTSMVVHEYDRITGIAWMNIGSVAANVTQFDFSLLAPVSSMRFRIRPRNASGFGPWDVVEGTRIDVIPVNEADKPVAVTGAGAIVLATNPVPQAPGEPPVEPPPGTTNPTVIGLGPDLQTVQIGQTVTLTVTLTNAFDTALNVALASDDTGVATVPATVAVPVGNQSAQFNVTGVSEGAALITATYNSTARSTTVNVDDGVSTPPSQGGNWPNQPAGSTILTDTDMSVLRTLNTGGWSPTWSGGGNLVSDATAPVSPNNVLEWTWTHDPNAGPGNGANHPQPVFSFGSLGATNFYMGFYVKVLSPFYGWSNLFNKVGLLWHLGSGDKFYNFLFKSNSVQGGPYVGVGLLNYISVDNSHTGAQGGQTLFPNAGGNSSFPLGVWNLVEVHHVKSTSTTSRDGIYRVFLNDSLIINHTNMNYPAGNFQQQMFTPVWDGFSNPSGVVDREYYDHVRITTGGTY